MCGGQVAFPAAHWQPKGGGPGRTGGSSATGCVRTMPNARSVVDGADIVCSTTNSAEPVVFGEWLANEQYGIG